MKKTAIALLTFAAAMFAVSCQKENNPVQNVSGPMTISAEAEGINTLTKTELAFKYDVLWRSTDKIYVVDGSGEHDTFSLQNGAGTTKGSFKQDGKVTFTGEVQAYYPATMLESGTPVWPASQANDQTIPMYCKKTLSGETEERMDFTSLGSVLQIVFNTTQENVTLKSIEIKDGSATLSGAFTVDADGKASITATDKAGITLDLGTGVLLGKGANFFNIAVPVGNYQALTLIFTATDGSKCVFNDGKLDIKHNTVGKLVLTGKTFKPDLPDGALPGVFSVSATKKVHFSQGNLYYDGSAFKFEANQYEIQTGWSTSHVSHFFWSKDASVAYAASYSESGMSDSDVFFTNAEAETAKSNFTVNGVTGKYRTLSTAEWQYLFNTRSHASQLYKYDVTVCGKTNCVVLLPDGWTCDKNTVGEDWQTDGYPETSTEKVTWKTMEDAGAVCLPAAGLRDGSNVDYVGGYGFYWSSTADGESLAYLVYFDSGYVSPDFYDYRLIGFSVRLITESK